jgi:hypothetical protein
VVEFSCAIFDARSLLGAKILISCYTDAAELLLAFRKVKNEAIF